MSTSLQVIVLVFYYYLTLSSTIVPSKCLCFSLQISHPTRSFLKCSTSRRYSGGWFERLFPTTTPAVKTAPSSADARQTQFPEQYPATYELSNVSIASDGREARMVRPLLKQTQLQDRKLQVAYNAQQHGWDARSFHRRVDGKGASIVVATGKRTTNGHSIVVGGYNPKGWSSLGGARPSVAAFLFYSNSKNRTGLVFQKLRKVGGGGLACAKDDFDFGIAFGADALLFPLQPGKERVATSKLGNYYERGPEQLSSLFGNNGGELRLESLKVLVGVYKDNEEIPYSGAVLDMTSG